MKLSHSSTTACPAREELLALVGGVLGDEKADKLDQHIAACDTCELTLASIEEESDTVVRALAASPATDDDEVEFQNLYRTLLSQPESFLVEHSDAPTSLLHNRFAVEIVLPYQLGNYDLLEQIGAGAQGAVFRARHRRLDRPVAVKLLMHAAVSAVDEFLNEMRVIGRLDHPHIIRATDAGEVDGLYFLVMDYVAGLDVSSLMKKVGRLRVADACEIARQAALGLAFAHQHHLVHRDVKTSNLLFTSQGQVKLLDLGLAKMVSAKVDPKAPAQLLPRGTADYMAPEQWRGADAVDHRADLYSLGCTLFKLLAGEPPYRHPPEGFRSKREAHIDAPIPSLKPLRNSVSNLLDQLTQRLLAKQADDRPINAEQVAQELERFTAEANLPELARQVFPSAPASAGIVPVNPRRRWVSRRSAIAMGLGALGALMLFTRRGSAPKLMAGEWRPLNHSAPLFLPGSSTHRKLDLEEEDHLVTSEGFALLHLGQPLRSAFRMRTVLTREDWSMGAGVFFRYRMETPAPDAEFSYYTLELISTENGATLNWMEHRTSENSRRVGSPIVLADAALPALKSSRKCQLDVTLGRKGFPEVLVDGQSFPETSWQISKEARDLMWTNHSRDQLRLAFAGRIGLFQRDGATRFGPSELMYLDP